MAIVTVVLTQSGSGALSSWTAPSDLDGDVPVVFHLIGGGQAGEAIQAGALSYTRGGDGADYATATASIQPNDVLDLQLGLGGVGVGTHASGFPNADGEAGTDTWIKDALGATIALARGGASATGASIGDAVNAGGSGMAPAQDIRGGGGGGGAGGPVGPGADGGDYASDPVGNDPLGKSWGGCGGGAGNGGKPGGGAYTIANSILHDNSDPIIGGDGGDDAAGNYGARWDFSSSGNGAGSGGAAGGQDIYNPGGPASGKSPGIGGSPLTWQDSDTGEWAGPGGGSGGGTGYAAAIDPGFAIAQCVGAPGGWKGGGGGGGAPYYYEPEDDPFYVQDNADILYAPGGEGGEGVLVIIYETGVTSGVDESSGVPSSGFGLVQPPCVTRWTQCVKIVRRDDVAFRFTTLDRDIDFRGETYKACNSIDSSATQTTSELGQIGNSEITGLLATLDIDEGALYGGLFDDAFVEIWLVPWEGADYPRRLAAGWSGKVSHSARGYQAEVLGPGSRLEQKPIVQVYTPGCRWVFGSTQCGVDIEALKATGEVMSAINRGLIFAALDQSSDGGSQWSDGRVRWTSGVNLGQICEVKTVDFAAGQIVLWALPAFLPEPGDEFDLLPGCDLSRTTCKDVYGNLINFGGFPDVPGQDAIMQAPDAKSQP